MDYKIEIYSSPTCHHCKEAKEFFKDHELEYVEYNVLADEARRKELVERSGQLGVPVIYIDNKMIVGFDEEKIKEFTSIS